MTGDRTSTHVPSELQPVLEELKQREPIFHRQASGVTAEDFDRLMAPDYWEVGATGSRYSRDFILQTLAHNPPIDAAAAGWRSSDFGLRRLGPDLYLLTYTLNQSGRITLRSTIWQKSEGHWRILYHQGTIVSASKPDPIPPES